MGALIPPDSPYSSATIVTALQLIPALVAVALLGTASTVAAQTDGNEESDPDDAAPVAATVAVEAENSDDDIAERLTGILEATNWFESVAVRVDTSVVFLDGIAGDERHRAWAGDLARNTQGVVAVVNEIEVRESSPWDLSPTFEQIRSLSAAAFRNLPLIGIGVVLLMLTWLVAGAAFKAVSGLLAPRVKSKLLRDVVSRTVGALIFVLGAYVVLRISGLTGLAVTIIGGTGLLGLAIGFAFRDIAENFLASILISIQRPFAMGDLINVDGHTGFVQRVNTRATLIMTRDGNHVQVPNAIIYKNTIVNYTANPRGREHFIVGIGYDDSVERAQSIALAVLTGHDAVLDKPEPMVLVEALGAATVNLRVTFWADIRTYDLLKVRSALIRLTKGAFAEAGISMPDEAREVVFPAGVPVVMQEAADVPPPADRKPAADDESPEQAHRAEAGLQSDDDEMERQARDARLPEGGENLL